MTRSSNPLISVVIPTCNRGWILKEAIDSVLSQDFKDFELIVVDDGSTDDTQDILAAYKKQIIVLKQNNKGVSAARNSGIRAASGTHIAFLDSDDLWLPEKLSLQIDFFQSNNDVLICQTQEIWIRNGVRVNPKKRHKKYSGDIFKQSLDLCLISPSAVMIKKILFKKVGLFDENFFACEDYDLWLRICCRYPVFLIDTPLTVKRGGHDDQLSKASGLDKLRIESIKKVLESNLLSKNQYMAAVRALKKKCDVYAGGCLKRGRMEEAKYYLKLTETILNIYGKTG